MEPLTLPEVTNIAGVAALHALLRERLVAADKAPLVVDCSAVRSIDAASLQCLLNTSREASRLGGRLELAGVSADFRRYADYVGLAAELIG
jgi:anti-anti-sigma factor